MNKYKIIYLEVVNKLEFDLNLKEQKYTYILTFSYFIFVCQCFS